MLTHHGLREGYHHKPPLHPLSDYRNRYWDTEVEEPSRVCRRQEKEEIFKAGYCPFPRQTWATGTASKKKLWTINTVRPYIYHLDRRNRNQSFCQNIIHPDRVHKAQRDRPYTCGFMLCPYLLSVASAVCVCALPPSPLCNIYGRSTSSYCFFSYSN
ncbi:uncharacterized protein LOC126721175 isoform X2 [Quercus robur]|uniref:uncharacterized protein LOC126721175 isoform X2 n=1 Tax=Quercus robur TaxID=38942 RepID=UPI00216344A9|nr:uncharacterized protein LOC126721175 isoform X2 [Quercus robur]